MWFTKLRSRSHRRSSTSSATKDRKRRDSNNQPFYIQDPHTPPSPLNTTTPPLPAIPYPTSTSTTALLPSPPPSPPSPSSPPQQHQQRPSLLHIPTDILLATERGMISGSMCAMPSSCSSSVYSTDSCEMTPPPTSVEGLHGEEGREAGMDVGRQREGEEGQGRRQVLTRGEEACRNSARKSVEEVQWERGRRVLFKGVDV
ncbi:hypothetical protein P3342_012781 [Pyrenophora teres f. teres]|nr:hypothetical protein P3342_012781 [Pyrenophora teres f. teres]